MKNSKIKEHLTKLFTENGNSPLSYNEIVMLMSLFKKEKFLLSETLQLMQTEGLIIKKSRKYQLNKIEPELVIKKPDATPKNPKLIEGVFDATPLSRNQSYAFVRTDVGDFYISSEDTLNAYHGDTVLIEPHYRKGKSDYASVGRIINRANETVAGDVKKNNNKIYFISSNPKIHNWFEVNDPGAAQEGEKVILEVTNWGNPTLGKMPVGKVIEVLGVSGDPQVELMAVIRQYRLPLEFPEEVLTEARIISEDISDKDITSRTDLRWLFTFTIDPASAKDFDDAISLESIENGWRLYVHIADVAHYVSLSGAIFTEAVKRGNSFYFPKKVIPMLPEMLSNKICSLRPEEDKLCLSVIADFDGKGNIIRQKLVESIINSNYRLSYEEVDSLFENKQTDLNEELCLVLKESRMLSTLLSKKRLAAGYIFFDLPELEYEYDDAGLLHRFTLTEETESHKLIENFMLVANEFVATKLKALSPTTIYRIHEDPDYEKINKLTDLLSHYGINYYEQGNLNASMQYLLKSLPGIDYHRVFDRIILRSMKKAKYSVQHTRHFGLGMETYTHFTSPIRRLCDLIIHQLCKTYILKSSNAKFGSEQVRHYAVTATEQELQADQAERDIERVYSMAYMKKRVGEKFSGMVVSAKSAGLIIHLNEIPVNAILKVAQFPSGRWSYKDREMRFVNQSNNGYFQLLDEVMVQIMDVSDDIYLELQQIPDAHAHHTLAIAKKTGFKLESRSHGHQKNSQRNAVDVKQAHRKSGHYKKRNRGSR